MTVTHMLKAGDGIVCMDDVYGGETVFCNVDSCAVTNDATLPLVKGWLILKRNHVVSTATLSQGTNRYFQRIAAEVGLEVSFADCTKPEKLKSALKANTKVRPDDALKMKCCWCWCCLFAALRVQV